MSIFLDNHQIRSIAASNLKRYGVYFANHLEDHEEHISMQVMDEVAKIVGLDSTMLIDSGMFFFDSEEEARTLYSVFETDIVYASGFYACLYAPDGTCLDINT